MGYGASVHYIRKRAARRIEPSSPPELNVVIQR